MDFLCKSREETHFPAANHGNHKQAENKQKKNWIINADQIDADQWPDHGHILLYMPDILPLAIP